MPEFIFCRERRGGNSACLPHSRCRLCQIRAPNPRDGCCRTSPLEDCSGRRAAAVCFESAAAVHPCPWDSLISRTFLQPSRLHTRFRSRRCPILERRGFPFEVLSCVLLLCFLSH